MTLVSTYFLWYFFFLLLVGEVEDDLDVDVSDSESESVLKKSIDKLMQAVFYLIHFKY